MGDVKIDPEILKSLGTVQKGFPEEPIPYNPSSPKPFSIQRLTKPLVILTLAWILTCPKRTN